VHRKTQETCPRRFSLLFCFVLLLFLVFSLSGCVELTPAYISPTYLTHGWQEDTSLRNTGIQAFGMEKWQSFTYRTYGDFPAQITVTTMKSLVLNDERTLLQNLNTTILDVYTKEFDIDFSSVINGERSLENGAQSHFFVYNATTKDSPMEQVKIIGEVWNCVSTGASVLCHGYAQITMNAQSSTNRDGWNTMIQDPQGSIEEYTGTEGLLYHVRCS